MPDPGSLATARTAAATKLRAAAAAVARARRPAERMLHVLNGDAAAAGLRAAGIDGQITLAADVLYEGPAAAASPERWRRERARFLAASGYEGYDESLARLTAWDRALEGFRNHDEVVLWFEHDLFDQLQICRLLAWFAARDTGLTDLTLIDVGPAGDYLGRMPPQQLTGLLESRQPVGADQKRLAYAVWAAFCAPEPVGLEALLRADTSALPYLAAALRRHLEEFPGVTDGLSRSERQALEVVAAGPLPFAALFAATQVREERIFMTDLSLLRRLRDLAAGPRPLLRIDPTSGFWASAARNPRVAITGNGLRVLAGTDDWIALRGGIDLWLGGVHLQGREAAWRWHPQAGRLVPTLPPPHPPERLPI